MALRRGNKYFMRYLISCLFLYTYRSPFIFSSLSQTLAGMGKLMRECWHGKPAARLPILRVKKTLIKLAANDPRVHLHLD